jgi:hypothetical protein
MSNRVLAAASVTLLVVSVALSACTSSESSGPEPGDFVESSQGQAEAEAETALMTADAAGKAFLAAVCPTDTALHLVETVSLSVGGWGSVKPKEVRPYTAAAIDAAGLASDDLSRDDWPEDVASLMPEVAREHLELLTPLEEMNQAGAGAQMQGPWKRIRSLPRVAEQEVRLKLGLGGVNSRDDGCPPAPRVPKADPSVSPSMAAPVTPTDYRTRLCTTSASSLPAVSRGESSSNVRLLQWSLAQLGYYGGAIGGNYGDKTFDATYRFQLANGLGRTSPGSVGVNTWSWLQYYLC